MSFKIKPNYAAPQIGKLYRIIRGIAPKGSHATCFGICLPQGGWKENWPYTYCFLVGKDKVYVNIKNVLEEL